MELDAASQAQLAAFLLAQSPPAPHQHAPVHSPPHSTASSPFDPVQALAALQWGSIASDLNHTELDGWLQEQLNALTQLPVSLPTPPSAPSHQVPLSVPPTPLAEIASPAPAQPHAFPPISSSRFHPYDRHQTKPERPRWHSHPIPQPQPQPLVPTEPPLYSPPQLSFRQPVLYPPDDTPSPLIVSHSQVTTPRSITTPSHVPTPPNASSLASPCLETGPPPARPTGLPPKRRRTRSLPSIPTFLSSTSLSTGPRARLGGEPSDSDSLESLFDWMDETRWNLSSLLTALSEVPGSSSTSTDSPPHVRGGDMRTPTHRRRIRELLNLDDSGSSREGGESWESRLRRWKKERKINDTNRLEKGADEIVRMWEEQGGLGRKAEMEKGMEDAVKELHLNGGTQGPVAGVAIRSVINRYHEAYNESQADIARLDAALSRPPSPHLASAPREPAAWSGHLVVPPLQADLLSHWLMSPGRPNLQEERSKGSIEADHMRIYSSLSPLDLHARGAEICRTILARDDSTRSLFGQHWDSIHLFMQGPSIAPLDTAGFNQYDDYSLWHHALMCYLQLCVRYPAFKESKEAHILISPDLPPPVHPTALETSLIDRLLRSHWDYLRLYLLQEHGGLLRSAVRGFEGVKLSRFDLLSVVGDTIEVIEALKKSRDSSDRILPYDASVSQVRNAWRQRAFWDPQASWVAWSAATTHFLELSALNKEWAHGVMRTIPSMTIPLELVLEIIKHSGDDLEDPSIYQAHRVRHRKLCSLARVHSSWTSTAQGLLNRHVWIRAKSIEKMARQTARLKTAIDAGHTMRVTVEGDLNKLLALTGIDPWRNLVNMCHRHKSPNVADSDFGNDADAEFPITLFARFPRLETLHLAGHRYGGLAFEDVPIFPNLRRLVLSDAVKLCIRFHSLHEFFSPSTLPQLRHLAIGGVFKIEDEETLDDVLAKILPQLDSLALEAPHNGRPSYYRSEKPFVEPPTRSLEGLKHLSIGSGDFTGVGFETIVGYLCDSPAANVNLESLHVEIYSISWVDKSEVDRLIAIAKGEVENFRAKRVVLHGIPTTRATLIRYGMSRSDLELFELKSGSGRAPFADFDGQ